MGSSGALMGLSTAGQGISAIGSAYSQSQAMKTQGEYQKMQYETNARMADADAEDALKRGETEANTQASKGAQVVGAQRAALAAQGINVDSGTAATLQDQTVEQARKDSETIRSNAWREAWGFRVQANNARGAGEFAQMGANNAAQNTLVTGGLQALQAGVKGYADYRSKQPGDSSGSDRANQVAKNKRAARDYYK